MIDAVMSQINNHFARSVESKEFEIVADGVLGNFQEKYVAGQYIWLKNTFVNDGVYKLSVVTSTKLTVEETLVAENTGETINIFGLAPPVDFINVVTEIANYTSKDGIASESIDDYSVAYGGTSGGDGSWVSVYANKLKPWKRMYDDDKSFSFGKIGWQNRLGC